DPISGGEPRARGGRRAEESGQARDNQSAHHLPVHGEPLLDHSLRWRCLSEGPAIRQSMFMRPPGGSHRRATPGCASTAAAHRPLSDDSLAALNEELAGRSATIIVADSKPGLDKRHHGDDVHVGGVTTEWRAPHAGPDQRARSVPTEALRSTSFRHYGRGALD